jgi:uncharacterized delta-60 repeat protein
MSALFSYFVRGAACALGVVVGGLLLSPSRADPGTLDPTFGTGGVVTIYMPSPSGSMQTTWMSARELPDGRIQLAGTCGSFPNQRLCLTRLTANGTIDPTFGTGGFATALPSTSSVLWGHGLGMTVERDGRITVTGYCGGTAGARLCYARFSASGGLVDTGQQEFAAGESFGLKVLRDREGRRVFLTECGFAICLLRLQADGTPDTSFGTNGTAVLSSGTDFFKPTGIAESLNGTLHVSATCEPPAGGFRACLVTVNSNGQLATWFGNGGRALMPSIDESTGQALALEADGSILLAGVCRVNPSERRPCLSRVSPEGTFLGTLGTGLVVQGVTSGDHSWGVLALQPDGRSVMMATCRDSGATTYDICALRLKQNGAFDATFGSARSGRNRFLFDPGFSQSPTTVIVRSNGAILVAATWGGTGRVFQLRGGPHGAPQCGLDLDGDGVIASATDTQILTRVLMGMSGDAVLAGLPLAPHATRGTWPTLRTFLARYCGMQLP